MFDGDKLGTEARNVLDEVYCEEIEGNYQVQLEQFSSRALWIFLGCFLSVVVVALVFVIKYCRKNKSKRYYNVSKHNRDVKHFRLKRSEETPTL